jgi:hypothetical protein
MTYGALVVQLFQDYEDYAEVNKQLEKMGYSIGTRLIEDFLARSAMGRCADFRETGEVVSKVRPKGNNLRRSNLIKPIQVGFKSFLNITPNITHSTPAPPSTSTKSSTPQPAPTPSAPGTYFMLTFDENPLAEFVELPDEALAGGLWYSNVLCGVIRGALEMVSVERYFSAIYVAHEACHRLSYRRFLVWGS